MLGIILSHFGGVDALRNRLEQLGKIGRAGDTRIIPIYLGAPRRQTNRDESAPAPPTNPSEGGTMVKFADCWMQLSVCNDPSAGSPTETLLRLLLPLNDKV